MLLTTSSALLFVSLLVYGPAAATFWSVFNSNHRPPPSYSSSSSSSGYGYGYGSNGLSSSYSRFKRHVPRLEKANLMMSANVRPVNNVYTTVAPTVAQLPGKPSLKNPVEVFGILNSKLLSHAAQYNKQVEDEMKRQQITWLSIPGWDSMKNKTTSLGGSIYPKLFVPADMTLQAMMAMRKKLESLGPSAISSLPTLPKLRIGIALPPRPEPTVNTYQRPCPEVPVPAPVTKAPVVVNTYQKPCPEVPVPVPVPVTKAPVIKPPVIASSYDKPCSGAAVIGKQQQEASSSLKVSDESSKADLSLEKDEKKEAKISVDNESKLTASSVSGSSSSVSGNLESSAKADLSPSPSTSNLNEESSVSDKDAIGMPSQISGEAKSASAPESASVSASASVSGPVSASSSLSGAAGVSGRKSTLSGSSSEIQPFFNLIQPDEPLAATKVEIDPPVDGKLAEVDQDDALNGQNGFANSDNNDGLNLNPSSVEDESARADASNQESMFSSIV